MGSCEAQARAGSEAGRSSRPGGRAAAAAGGALVQGVCEGRWLAAGFGAAMRWEGLRRKGLWGEGSALFRRLRPRVLGGAGLVWPERRESLLPRGGRGQARVSITHRGPWSVEVPRVS